MYYCIFCNLCCLFFFFQAEDGIRDGTVTGVQTCALPISFNQYARALTLVRLSDSRRESSRPKTSSNSPHRTISCRLQEDRKSVRVGKECRSRWSPYH